MAKHLSNLRYLSVALIAVVCIAGFAAYWSTNANTVKVASKSLVQWDEKESKELAQAFHHMHQVGNAGDLEALKKLVIGDDVLVTFELGPDNRSPVALSSRDELFSFMNKLINAKDEFAQQGSFFLEMPEMQCRATKTFGVCTEFCVVRIKAPDGKERVDYLYGTSTAVKYTDGWKMIQWHMSVGSKPPAARMPHAHSKH